ncbi:hypothetical protein B7P43_G11575 [Cryptotermes secundus]|uniref:Reverse transcriptase domain-containing protein n=1 Tax=Cryptotermes secundus TaxID=105785 RepID=A0A2J7R7C9_9NEOP|nr:hypothetical protein B7P43_G11575 [Cryptotermes secundus]
MIINPAKSKTVCFTRARATNLLNYSLWDIVIPEASSCKYLGIILRSDLGWADQVNYAAKFAHHKNDSNWETLTRHREIARICALFKAYTGERAWEAIGDRLERPCYLSRVDHDRKIISRKQKTDIGKYSFVNRTIQLWNQLPADALGALSYKPSNFRKKVRKAINKAKLKGGII